MALTSDGKVFCWGGSGIGIPALGNAAGTTSSNLPIAVDMTGVLAGKTVTQVAAYGCGGLALTSEGKVYAWGFGGWGTLGRPGANFADSNVPVAVDVSGVLAGKTVTAIAAGIAHAMALTSEGKVYTWGYGYNGELGNNTADASGVPVAVTTVGTSIAGKTITKIAAGGYFCLALASDGTLHSWGQPTALGRTSSTAVAGAVNVGALAGKTVTGIGTGGNSAFAIDSTGKPYAWGSGSYGNLGTGGGDTTLPVAMVTSGALSGKTVTAISGGFLHTVILTSDGAVYTCGTNSAGGLGIGGAGGIFNVPLPVVTAGTPMAGKTITSIAAGAPDGYGTSYALAGTPAAPDIAVAQGSAVADGGSVAFGTVAAGTAAWRRRSRSPIPARRT